MMNFREGKKSLVKILSDSAAGRYQTIGAQKQVKDSKDLKGEDRYVQVYYSSGDFELSTGRQSGPTQHKITYKIELSVSASAKVDLATINSETASIGEKKAALEGLRLASDEADDSIDELADIVYQVIMNGENLDVAFPKGKFSQRWIAQIQKDDPTPRGELLVLTGSMILTAKTAEQVSGATGVDGNTNDATIELVGDDNAKQGVTQQN